MKYQKNKNPGKRFSGKKSFPKRLDSPSFAKEISISQINFEIVGQTVSLMAFVDSISQTSGPTLFNITDGTGTFVLKGFSSPGERTFPEIKEGTAIETIAQINEYNNMLEGEIKKISILTEPRQTQ